jgi:hypothetical protein
VSKKLSTKSGNAASEPHTESKKLKTKPSSTPQPQALNVEESNARYLKQVTGLLVSIVRTADEFENNQKRKRETLDMVSNIEKTCKAAKGSSFSKALETLQILKSDLESVKADPLQVIDSMKTLAAECVAFTGNFAEEMKQSMLAQQQQESALERQPVIPKEHVPPMPEPQVQAEQHHHSEPIQQQQTNEVRKFSQQEPVKQSTTSVMSIGTTGKLSKAKLDEINKRMTEPSQQSSLACNEASVDQVDQSNIQFSAYGSFVGQDMTNFSSLLTPWGPSSQ